MKYLHACRYPTLTLAWCVGVMGIGDLRGNASSFFPALEVTPRELAASGRLPSVSAMAALPAGEKERREWIEALLDDGIASDGGPSAEHAIQLLEIWGGRRAALEWMNGGSARGVDPMHYVRLLYREGDIQRAREGFDVIQATGHRWRSFNERPSMRVFAATQPLMEEGADAEMVSFLAWLQPRSTLSEWRSALLARRLELALASNRLQPLLNRLAMESAVSAQIAAHWLDPSQPMSAPRRGTSVSDLAWWISIQGCTDEIEPLMRNAIKSAAGNDAERRELFRQMMARSNREVSLERLFPLWMKREAEFIRLLKEADASLMYSPRLPFVLLCEMADRHPEDVELNLIAGLNQTRIPAGTGAITQGAVDCLTRTWLTAPLQKTNQSGAIGGPGHLPRWQEDPAAHAIHALRDRITPSRLHELIYGHRDFAELQMNDQHRYLIAADLDAAAFELTGEHQGREISKPRRTHDEATRTLLAKVDAISWFGPPSGHGFPFGYHPEPLGRPSMMFAFGPKWFGEEASGGYHPCAWLVPRFPALGHILDSKDHTEAAKWAARIREVLGDGDPLAAAYDIAILVGELETDDARVLERARAHMGARLDAEMEPDFVLMRSSRGVSLQHARPAEVPEAIRELWEIRDASMPYRIAAMDVANAGRDPEFRDRLREASGTVGTQHRNRQIGRPPDPIPPPLPEMRTLYNRLKKMPTPDERIQFLSNLPATHRSSPYALLVFTDLLEEMEPPHHLKVLELMRMRHEPTRGFSGKDDAARFPEAREIARLHRYFFKLDGDAAASFRELASDRGWVRPTEVAEHLLDVGDRDASVRWLARTFVDPFDSPPRWLGPHRSPTRANPRDEYLLDQVLPIDALKLMRAHDLTADIASTLDAEHGDQFKILVGFFRFYQNPTLEHFEQHLGGIKKPEQPHLANTLRMRVSYLLNRFPEHLDLAHELRESARNP